MKLRIANLRSGHVLPEKYTCDGANLSPPLIVQNVPDEARSLAMFMIDPDIEYGAYTHWLIWNLPAKPLEIPEGLPPGPIVEGFPDSVQGHNGEGDPGYTGPCPPEGEEHHYFLTLFALEDRLDLDVKANRTEVRDALRGHVLNSSRFHTFYGRGMDRKNTNEADVPLRESRGEDEPKGRLLDDFR